MQEDKKRFAKQYEAMVMALSSRQAEFAALDLALRERLMKERAHFNTVLQENMHALNMAQHGTKRLVDRILEAARQAVAENSQTNYSNGGKAMSYKSASMSLSVDKNL